MFDPLYFARQAIWFWAVMAKGILSDIDTVTTKPKLVTIQGGKSVR